MSQMSQKLRQGVFDEITLRVNPKSTDSCRQIVPEDPNNACYVSANGELYEDNTWKVQLLTMPVAFNGQQQYRVRIDYKGKNAYPGTRCYGGAQSFDTGLISICIMDHRRKDGSVESKIDVKKSSYGDLLSNDFGIWDGYVFSSPNDYYMAEEEDDFSVAIVSDGKVTCWFGDKRVEDPDLKELAEILQADESYYEVSGATWAVMIQCDKDSGAASKVELYTEENDFEELLKELEQYLDKMELGRFDDIVNEISKDA